MRTILPGVLCAVILSSLLFFNLGSGYVIQLDTVFGPASWKAGIDMFFKEGTFYGLFLYLVTHVIEPGLFSRLYVSVIFCLVCVVPYILATRLLHSKDVLRTIYSAGVISVLFSSNPFVIGRMVAGQWNLVLGYICIPIILYLYYRYAVTHKYRYIYLAVGSMFVQTIFSLHMYIVTILCIAFLLVYVFKREYKQYLIPIFSILISLIPNTYIYFSYTHNFGQLQLGTYHQQFSIWSLILLQGFWLDSEPWGNTVYLPYIDASYLYTLCIGVMYVYLVYRKRVEWILPVICIYILQYLYIPYFSIVFRDIGKLLVIPILILSISLISVIQDMSFRMLRIMVLGSLCLFIFLVVSVFQLETYNLPQSVVSARELIREPCTALVLPWYQYYSKTYFQQGNAVSILSPNPARHIYPCRIIQSLDTRLDISNINGVPDELYLYIDSFIHASNMYQIEHANDFLGRLKNNGVNYIIFDTSVIQEDTLRYVFLKMLNPVQNYTGDLFMSTIVYKL